MAKENIKEESVQEENNQQPVKKIDTKIYKMMAYQFYRGVCDGYEAAAEELESLSDQGDDVNSKRIKELTKDQKTYYNIKDYIEQILISKGLSDVDVMKLQQKANEAANSAAYSQKGIDSSIGELAEWEINSHNSKVRKAKWTQIRADGLKRGQSMEIGQIVVDILENKQLNRGIENIKDVLKQELYPEIKDIHETSKKKQRIPLITGILLILVAITTILIAPILGPIWLKIFIVAIIIGGVSLWYKSKIKRKMVHSINRKVYVWTSTYLLRDNE